MQTVGSSKKLITFVFSVEVNNRLSACGGLDDQLGIGEVSFASSLTKPTFHEER
jgi:hypothetical protein